MSRGISSEEFPLGSAQRGLWRLMLKLPALRGKLQILNAKTTSLVSLCEAYEDSCVTLQRLRSDPFQVNSLMLKEYETICLEIEADVIQYCIDHTGRVPD